MQVKVRRIFDNLRFEDEGRIPWHVVDASGSVEDVQEKLRPIVLDTLNRVKIENLPLMKLWDEGIYDLN